MLLCRALQLALAVVLGLMEVLESPLFAEEATTARIDDAAQGSGSICIARHDPYDQWKSSNILDESLKLVLLVLEKSGSSGPQNSATSIALLHVRTLFNFFRNDSTACEYWNTDASTRHPLTQRTHPYTHYNVALQVISSNCVFVCDSIIVRKHAQSLPGGTVQGASIEKTYCMVICAAGNLSRAFPVKIGRRSRLQGPGRGTLLQRFLRISNRRSHSEPPAWKHWIRIENEPTSSSWACLKDVRIPSDA